MPYLVKVSTITRERTVIIDLMAVHYLVSGEPSPQAHYREELAREHPVAKRRAVSNGRRGRDNELLRARWLASAGRFVRLA